MGGPPALAPFHPGHACRPPHRVGRPRRRGVVTRPRFSPEVVLLLRGRGHGLVRHPPCGGQRGSWM
eukprot:15453719-Alexandrium_andersonii.AAC.1